MVNQPHGSRSSPVGSDPDPDKEITEYIEWLIEKVPGQRDLFFAAKDKLVDAALDLAQLRRLDEHILAEMDIPLGIRMKLKSNVKVFKRRNTEN